MKTTHLALCALALAASTSLAACGNSDHDHDTDLKPSAVPNPVTTAFIAQYPTASHVEWEKQGRYYKADFRTKGGLVEADAWYTSAGQWAMTQFDYGQNTLYLPNAVSEAFVKSQYSTWKLDDIDEYQYPDTTRNLFIIEVEKPGSPDTDLYYRLADGTAQLIRTVTHSDLTPTPDTTF